MWDYLDLQSIEEWSQAFQESRQLKVLNSWVGLEQIAKVTEQDFLGEFISLPEEKSWT